MIKLHRLYYARLLKYNLINMRSLDKYLNNRIFRGWVFHFFWLPPIKKSFVIVIFKWFDFLFQE